MIIKKELTDVAAMPNANIVIAKFPRWISADKKPGNGVYVLGWYIGYGINICVYEHGVWSCDEFPWWDNPTHWMPLPEPPK